MIDHFSVGVTSFFSVGVTLYFSVGVTTCFSLMFHTCVERVVLFVYFLLFIDCLYDCCTSFVTLQL